MISSLGSQTLHCRAIWMLISHLSYLNLSTQSRAIFYNLYPVMVFASRSGFAMAEMFHCLKSKLMTIVAPAYLVLTSETTKPKQNLNHMIRKLSDTSDTCTDRNWWNLNESHSVDLLPWHSMLRFSRLDGHFLKPPVLQPTQTHVWCNYVVVV